METLVEGLPPNVLMGLLIDFAKVVADKVPQRQRELEARTKMVVTASSRHETIEPSKKSKDKNNKAAKRHRNVKESKSNLVDTKEQINHLQQVQMKETI